MFPDYIRKTQTITSKTAIYKLAYTYKTIAGIMGRYVNEGDNRNYTILTIRQANSMEYIPVTITPCKVTIWHQAHSANMSLFQPISYTFGTMYLKASINGY